MHQHTRTATLLIVLLAIMSGLYIFNRLVEPVPVIDTPAEIPFGGTTPPEISRGDSTKKQVIFTFDAGAGTVSVLPVLDSLRKHEVGGTFFITGNWASQNPELVRRIASEGHEVFNHTYAHPYLTVLSDEQIAGEFARAENILTNLTGSSTKPFFRPPYGDRDQRILQLAGAAGYQSVYWTIDAKDWKEKEGMTAYEVKHTILSNLHPGAIILMHVGDAITGVILDEVLTEVKRLGYTPVSLTQGL